MSALDPFLPHFKSKRDIAIACEVTDQAVQKWDEAIPVRPTNRVLQLCRIVGWKVTPHRAARDVYPHPEDGLPSRLRGKVKA